MGQYFIAVNLDKREYVCPWCISGGAKLWEWAVNRQGAIFTLLLRQSTEGGGGDYTGKTYEMDKHALAGRWAGDRVALVGDYDRSGLWGQRETYRNISAPLVAAWNQFIELREYQLTCNPCSGHAQPTP